MSLFFSSDGSLFHKDELEKNTFVDSKFVFVDISVTHM